MLIMLLEHSFVFKHEKLLEYLIAVIENITVHHFYKSINALVTTQGTPSSHVNDPIRIT